jgi:glycerol uptake facilitator-like aquaporin
MSVRTARPLPWQRIASELIGTALLVLAGLSLVILMFGTGSPMARVIPGEGLRRLITGFLFGTTGACIALSPVGRVSGAHINPAVTLAVLACSFLAKRIEVAKLHFFDSDRLSRPTGATPSDRTSPTRDD